MIRNRTIGDKVVLRAVGITVGSLLFVMAMALLISIASNLNGKDRSPSWRCCSPASPPLPRWGWISG